MQPRRMRKRDTGYTGCCGIGSPSTARSVFEEEQSEDLSLNGDSGGSGNATHTRMVFVDVHPVDVSFNGECVRLVQLADHAFPQLPIHLDADPFGHGFSLG